VQLEYIFHVKRGFVSIPCYQFITNYSVGPTVADTGCLAPSVGVGRVFTHVSQQTLHDNVKHLNVAPFQIPPNEPLPFET
jgi:hypothetical protein